MRKINESMSKKKKCDCDCHWGLFESHDNPKRFKTCCERCKIKNNFKISAPDDNIEIIKIDRKYYELSLERKKRILKDLLLWIAQEI